MVIHPKAHSFEVDGFKSGMSQEKVMDRLNKLNFWKIEREEGFIMAHDDLAKKNMRAYSFNFSKGKLTKIQKEFSPSMKHFIILFDKLSTYYGKPIDSHAGSSDGTHGEQYGIEFLWRKELHLITLKYNVFPMNDQLSVLYEVE
jgi:hypothetical protein